MHAPLRRLFAPAIVALSLSLAACGGGNEPAAQPTSAPAASAPTRTPRPTREPLAEPTATAAPTTAPEPTAAAAEGEILPVEFADLQTFEHPSGVFTIDIPENWAMQDNSKPDEIIHVWTDPTRNGGVIVDIFEDETAYTEEQLTDILSTFLENSFGSEPDFSVDPPETQNDGSVLLAWGYTATADNDTPVDMTGNSFIEQRENKVSILTTLVPHDQFDSTVEFTNEIINSYLIDPSAILSTTGSADGGSDSGITTGGSAASGDMPATVVAIGDTVEVGPGLTMTITGVEEPAGDSFFKPEEGNRFLIVRASFANSGSETQPISTLLQMALLDSSGTKYDIDILAATLAEQTPDGDVPAGGTLEGGAGFQIPSDATGLVFVFSPLIDGEPVGVALE
jgi:hypothetical protein